jgi:hypothetical protein
MPVDPVVLRQLLEDMMLFVTAKPSPQQTRQKSAREMVEYFAHELKAILLAGAVVPLPPETEAEDLSRGFRGDRAAYIPHDCYRAFRERERALALTYALALMRDRLSVETNANAAVIQRHIYRLIELVADVQGATTDANAVDPVVGTPAVSPPVEPPPQEEHDPLCSQGQHAGDQTMPCDCHLSRLPPASLPPAAPTPGQGDEDACL